MSIEKSEISSQVREFVVNNFLMGGSDSFEDSDSFLDKGIIDSTGVLEVIGYLEETFNITVEDSEMLPENLDSVENIMNFVAKKTESNN